MLYKKNTVSNLETAVPSCKRNFRFNISNIDVNLKRRLKKERNVIGR